MNGWLGRAHPCNGRGFAFFVPGLDVAESLTPGRKVDNDAVRITHHRTVDAHITNAGVVITRDNDCGDVRRLVFARRPGDDRWLVGARLRSGQHDFLTHPAVDELRLVWLAQSVGDPIIDLLNIALERECDTFG